LTPSFFRIVRVLVSVAKVVLVTITGSFDYSIFRTGFNSFIDFPSVEIFATHRFDSDACIKELLGNGPEGSQVGFAGSSACAEAKETALKATRTAFASRIEFICEPFVAVTVAISEAEELTQRKSKTADRGLRLHRFVLALLRARARAQYRGARARNRRHEYTRSGVQKHHRISSPSE
jgi:hypothetical protein